MSKPIVAIVGRPNVGKSTLFNRIMNERISIVEETPGVTRDRIYGDAEWQNKVFTLVDTGGIEFGDNMEISRKIRSQVDVAINDADLILFTVDAKVGVTHDDIAVASILRKSAKPIILVANKVDNFSDPTIKYQFLELGLGEAICVSAANGLNTGDLLDEIIKTLDFSGFQDTDGDVLKVAIVGRPNVGKSSFVNALLNEERLIVTNIPGTTRDAIDTPFSYNDRKYILIDTAGVRRKSKVDDSIEYYSVLRTIRAIERANVVVLMLDAQEGLCEQDQRIAGIAHEAGRALVIAVNKWDSIEKETNTALEYEREIRSGMKFADYASVVFISALTGQRIYKVLDIAAEADSQHKRQITTGKLNEVIQEAVAKYQPPLSKGRQLKLYYATQTGTRPPRFTVFVNNPKLVHFSYTRFLENQLRERFGFEGTPIVIEYRSSRE